jgi:hypothetical protein
VQAPELIRVVRLGYSPPRKPWAMIEPDSADPGLCCPCRRGPQGPLPRAAAQAMRKTEDDVIDSRMDSEGGMAGLETDLARLRKEIGRDRSRLIWMGGATIVAQVVTLALTFSLAVGGFRISPP